MKRLPPPDLDAVEVYRACVGEILNADLSMRFLNVVDNWRALAHELHARAVANELHLYQASKRGNGDQIVFWILLNNDLESSIIDMGISHNFRSWFVLVPAHDHP